MHGWILPAAISQPGDIARYVGLAWYVGLASSAAALMPLAMTGFGALISLSSIPIACVLVAAAFAALVL